MVEKKVIIKHANGNTNPLKYKRTFLKQFDTAFNYDTIPELFSDVELIFSSSDDHSLPFFIADIDENAPRFGIPDDYYWLRGYIEGEWALVKQPYECMDAMWKIIIL